MKLIPKDNTPLENHFRSWKPTTPSKNLFEAALLQNRRPTETLLLQTWNWTRLTSHLATLCALGMITAGMIRSFPGGSLPLPTHYVEANVVQLTNLHTPLPYHWLSAPCYQNTLPTKILESTNHPSSLSSKGFSIQQ